jgi:hypothetical protein
MKRRRDYIKLTHGRSLKRNPAFQQEVSTVEQENMVRRNRGIGAGKSNQHPGHQAMVMYGGFARVPAIVTENDSNAFITT